MTLKFAGNHSVNSIHSYLLGDEDFENKEFIPQGLWCLFFGQNLSLPSPDSDVKTNISFLSLHSHQQYLNTFKNNKILLGYTFLNFDKT